MSMLRRPLTQLELCEDDITWLAEQLTKREVTPVDEPIEEDADEVEDEPMDESEPPRGISRRNLRSADRKNKDVPGTSGVNSRSATRESAMASVRTPVAAPSLSLSTPVNAGPSSTMHSLPPPARLPRPGRRPRATRVADNDLPLLFNAYDTPQQAAGGNNGSPTPSDSPESPNAHLYSTPSNQASSSGGPSSNTRSHRH
ncbi:hypothetical protein GCK72_002438 [Caenorhabditis remanei]|uniref:Anaphase-promoting complex subunit CDC26 n=1 Tax=Caenorhabditis remanei TaxID=31234 RepID=A0A6A5HSE0_CAERE|nr:hypothetical protein GCK72_002438 [Caenorhabditis remanei]KAF1770619.1 hypothetical protein GCK72_002438 [Caenorhabditis remanei]